MLKSIGSSLILGGLAFLARPSQASFQPSHELSPSPQVIPQVISHNSHQASQTSLSGNSEQPIPGIVRPECRSDTQIAMNRCAGRWQRLSTQLHTEIIEEIEQELWSRQTAQQQLRTAEQSWKTFRETQCEQVAKEVIGGSLHPFVINSCLAQLTNERIANLYAWQPTNSLSIRQPSRRQAERQLQAAYTDLLQASRLPNGQDNFQFVLIHRRWQQYRADHCQFEAMASISSEGFHAIESRCLTRLAIERLPHLAKLNSLSR